MLNTFAWIDHHAACAESPWHHAGAAGKLLFTALVVALAVTAPSWCCREC